MAYLHGTFKNLSNETVEVRITSGGGGGEILIGDNDQSSVFFDAENPVTITLNNDDLFSVIIPRAARINLYSKVYLGDSLFSANPTDIEVKIYKSGALLFDGFGTTNSYNQPYAHTLDSLEINCVDKLSVLSEKFWTDSTSYSALVADTAIYSFKQILQKIGLGSYNVYYDGSKTVNGQSAFTVCGVSLNVFLGDSEDKIMSYAEVLESVLRYLNLHIVQYGSDLYIFDWANVANNNLSWSVLFGSGTGTMSGANIAITKAKYSDDSTTLSMSEVYNQIQVKCICESVVDLVPSALDTGDLQNIYGDAGKGQLCLTECWYDGEINGKDAARFMRDSAMFSDENSISVSAADPTKWHAKDWFVKWQTNSKWTLRYNNSVIDSLVSYEGNTPIYQQNLLRLLYDNKFMPALIKCGSAPEINNNNQSRRGSPQMSNYLVISGCAGWSTESHYYSRHFANKSELDAAVDAAISTAAGTGGMITYSSGSALNASPSDDDSLNFIIIDGHLSLEPHHAKTGVAGPNNADIIRSSAGASWGALKDWFANDYDLKWFGGHNYYSHVNGVYAHYQQVPWSGHFADSANTLNLSASVNYVSPPVGGNVALDDYYYQQKFTYNQSKTADGWSSADTINKIPLLECQLKIGDKYCVEDFEHLDIECCPTFHWWTASEAEAHGYTNKSFSIGINPAIGDYIFGKEYALTNTADGRRLNYSGMAIPISKSDNLVGEVSFKVLRVLPVEWNVYVNIKVPKQSYRHIEGTRNLWAACSAMWIKDFSLKFESNSASDNTSGDKDLIYMSDVQSDFKKKKDDIEFTLNTQISSAEAAELGMSSSVSYSNVINLNTNSALASITAPNGTNRPERLYVDQYYNMYSTPKVIMGTQLHNVGYSLFNTFSVSGFGKMTVLSIEENLQRNVIDINCRQI